MLSSYSSYSDRETPVSYLLGNKMEVENKQLKDELKKVKDENEKLKETIKRLVFHNEEIGNLLKNFRTDSDCNRVNNQSILSSAKKNTYDEYENRPARSRLTLNQEWDWENRPIKPASILINSVNQPNTDFNRRRSKSVCFGDKNLIHELIEIDNNRSSTENVEPVHSKIEENTKRVDSSEEETNRKEKPNKKTKTKQQPSKQIVNKPVAKVSKDLPKYNLDTSSESNQDDSRGEIQPIKPATVVPQVATNKCNCSGDCLTNRCSCKKSLTGCSSKCHNGNPCKNC